MQYSIALLCIRLLTFFMEPTDQMESATLYFPLEIDMRYIFIEIWVK